MMAFHVGQEVICIRESWKATSAVAVPRLNCKYTIREITVGVDGKEGLRLQEIVNRKCYRYLQGKLEECEPHFWSSHFRPLQKRSMQSLLEVPADPQSAAWDRKRTPARKTTKEPTQ